MNQSACGLGEAHPDMVVYIANRPPLDEYQGLQGMRVLKPGDIEWIVKQTGNHWRKIFNIYAKLGFALQPAGFASWQAYRDGFLLGPGSKQALRFSPPDLNEPCLHLVMGKGYAASLAFDVVLDEAGSDCSINRSCRLLQTPYFDYRQLSNQKLQHLLGLIQGMGC